MRDDVYAVLATGPSMSLGIAEYVKTRCRAVAVNDAFRIAPWADALVCNDRAWWWKYPEALDFAGRKFCGTQLKGTERLPYNGEFPPGTNSGLQGMRVAHMLGAKLVLLCGFDMHSKNGHHYFGPHPAPLRNTVDSRFRVHIAQFKRWTGCEVLNCTPGSALTQFPFADLRQVLDADVAA